MSTFRDLLDAFHDERFVGRETELAAFGRWLSGPGGQSSSESRSPGVVEPILAVSGPGGIGKSWLLYAFAKKAATEGWHTVQVEASTASRTSVLWDDSVSVARPPRSPVLFLVDGVDMLGVSLSALLRDLENLEVGTRVVMAGRSTMSEGVWARWEPLMRHMRLDPLDSRAQRRYLNIRGIDDAADRAWVQLRAGGNPLVMSLAVDALLSAGSDRARATERWRSNVGATVDQLLSAIPSSRPDAIEAAAVLHRFAPENLAQVLGVHPGDRSYLQLFTSSAVRATGDEFALHDDLRWAVIEDLRLHAPERLESIRRRALRYYRRAAQHAQGDERRRLLMERLHLVGRDIFGMSLLYDADPTVATGDAKPDELDEVIELLSRATLPGPVPRFERDPELLRPLLADPGTQVQVARDAHGKLIAYGFYTRVSERNRNLLATTPAMVKILAAVATELGAPGGRFPSDSNVLFLSTVVSTYPDWTVTAAMSRQIMDLFFDQGSYFLVPGYPEYMAAVEGTGARPFVSAIDEDGVELQPRLLDVSRVGIEGLLKAKLADTNIELLPLGKGMVSLVEAGLSFWDDDEALGSSPLVALTESDDAPVSERARAVRELILRAQRASGPWPTPEWRVYEALRELGDLRIPSKTQPATAKDPAPAAEESLPVRQAVAEEAPPPVGPAAAPGTVTIQALGGFAVRCDGAEIPVPSGVVATVVEVMAVRRAVSVDELIDTLWPDADLQTGRERLRTALARVRRAVGPQVIVRRGAEVALGPDVRSDVASFAELAAAVRSLPGGAPRAEAAKRAVDAYTGELLPGDRFADWSAAPRERLARQYSSLLAVIVEEALATGDTAAALDALERAIDADPYEEANYVRAAEILAESGSRGRAIAVLDRAEAAAASLGLPASSDVQAIRARLRSD